MAYRSKSRTARSRYTRSTSRRSSGRRSSRRASGRRSSGTVVRLVIEQPSASVVSRPELMGMTTRPSRKASF